MYYSLHFASLSQTPSSKVYKDRRRALPALSIFVVKFVLYLKGIENNLKPEVSCSDMLMSQMMMMMIEFPPELPDIASLNSELCRSRPLSRANKQKRKQPQLGSFVAKY